MGAWVTWGHCEAAHTLTLQLHTQPNPFPSNLHLSYQALFLGTETQYDSAGQSFFSHTVYNMGTRESKKPFCITRGKEFQSLGITEKG